MAMKASQGRIGWAVVLLLGALNVVGVLAFVEAEDLLWDERGRRRR